MRKHATVQFVDHAYVQFRNGDAIPQQAACFEKGQQWTEALRLLANGEGSSLAFMRTG